MDEFIKGFKNGFKRFGEHISTGINFILLGVVYFFGVGIVSIVARLFGKKFLKTTTEKKDSYWEEKNITTETKENYYRMF